MTLPLPRRPPVVHILRLLGVAITLGSLAGCGIYSMRFEPPRRTAVVVARDPPLDLSLSLGDVAVSVNGKPTTLDATALKRLDDSFVERATASRLVRSVLPRGSQSDLYYDMNTQLDLGGTPSLARTLYQLVAFIPAAL